MTVTVKPKGKSAKVVEKGLTILSKIQARRNRARIDQAGSGGALRCEIEVEEIGSSVQLQGIVYAAEAVQGAYDLQVSAAGGGGSSNIRQQGDFDAAAHEPARLGIVQLSKDGGAYKALLKVTGNGEAVSCEKRVGGGWL